MCIRDRLETYATGKNPTIKKLLKSEQKQKQVNKLNEDQVEQAEYIEQKYGPGPEPDDLLPGEYSEMASGGRVPLGVGGSPNIFTLDPEWDDMDSDEWLHLLKLLRAGAIGAAEGGRIPFSKGKGVMSLLELIQKKFPGTTKLGQTSKPMAEKTQLRKAIADFQEREKAAKLKIWENPDKVRAAVDDIFSTGDYKYDAEMAAEALVENNPKAFGGKLLDDLDDATQSDIYGEVLKVVQSDLGKMLQLKRASRPTKTLEGIKKTGTINISDPNVADEFTRFMKETDPKGHKKIEEIVEITNFDPKGKKGHASGGLAGMLGE